MPQVLVRDVPPAVLEKLKGRAHANGRSLQAELRLLLQRAAEESQVDIPAQLERVQALFAGRTFSDSAELLREDRDR